MIICITNSSYATICRVSLFRTQDHLLMYMPCSVTIKALRLTVDSNSISEQGFPSATVETLEQSFCDTKTRPPSTGTESPIVSCFGAHLTAVHELDYRRLAPLAIKHALLGRHTIVVPRYVARRRS